jgi:hypothetical protein
MIDEAWEPSHDIAGAPLPFGEIIVAIGKYTSLRDDRN